MKKEKKSEKESYTLPFREKKITGKIEGKSLVAYSFSLPSLLGEGFEESERFLEEIKNAFLLFLQKMSEVEREEVMFGGISFRAQGEKAVLFSSFSPFGERVFTPFATLTFSEDGEILEIMQIKGNKYPPV